MSDGHVPDDELAELDEGLLPPIRVAEVQAHLAGCEPCQRRVSDIADVRTTLTGLAPARIPTDVASRLTAAIAAERPQDSSSTATVVPLHAHRRWQRGTTAGAAASFIVLALIGGILIGHHRSKSHDNAGVATTAGGGVTERRPLFQSAPQQSSYQVHTTRRNYTPLSIVGQAPKLLSATTYSATGSPTQTQQGATPTAPVTLSPAASPTQSSSLRTASKSASGTAGLASRDSGRAEALPSGARVPASLKLLYDSRQALLSCAAAVTAEPGIVPLAVDFARWTNGTYHQAPVVVFLFRQTATTAAAIVVGPSCQGTDQNLDYTTVPLP